MAVVQLDAEDRQPENGFVSPDAASPELLTRIDGSVLPFLGGFGRYQKQLIVLTWIPALFIGFSQYSNNFLLAQPNNTCVQPPANLTNRTASHSSLSGGPRNASARPASLYDTGSYGTRNDTDPAHGALLPLSRFYPVGRDWRDRSSPTGPGAR
ncbi:Solute carrier family 22 member 23 [Liparis tanakae]|uniref:Solute carrier family 22 member 23 n=1 Tax=Liparis tanakae TaxID=230148 RepID=A0A4Z2ID27_9TELE|nr:Solute carrier family 22 member 23 [Liparis tanakae]